MNPMDLLLWACVAGMAWLMFASITGADEWLKSLLGNSKLNDLEKRVDPSKGKLFLVDMKASPPTVTQLNLELPSQIPDLKETAAMERFAQDTLDGLRKTDKTVDEFCRRIETKGS